MTSVKLNEAIICITLNWKMRKKKDLENCRDKMKT